MFMQTLITAPMAALHYVLDFSLLEGTDLLVTLYVQLHFYVPLTGEGLGASTGQHGRRRCSKSPHSSIRVV